MLKEYQSIKTSFLVCKWLIARQFLAAIRQPVETLEDPSLSPSLLTNKSIVLKTISPSISKVLPIQEIQSKVSKPYHKGKEVLIMIGSKVLIRPPNSRKSLSPPR